MKRGFTLVEMVLVLVIVSILAQLTNVAMKARREAAIVDVLTEYIQIFVGAMRMYYYNHQGNFPSDFIHEANLKAVTSLKPYLPRSFSSFKMVENCTVTAYVKEKEDTPPDPIQGTGNENTKSPKELVGYGFVVTGINDINILKKLKNQLLLEINMKSSSADAVEYRQVLLNLIQIIPQEGKFIFYLKTDNKSYL